MLTACCLNVSSTVGLVHTLESRHTPYIVVQHLLCNDCLEVDVLCASMDCYCSAVDHTWLWIHSYANINDSAPVAMPALSHRDI